MKPIKGFEKYYSVSKDGVVYRTATTIKGKVVKLKEPKPLKGYFTKEGYSVVFLNCPQGRKHFRLHILVWETYNKPLKRYESVRYKDGNKENNRLDNLEVFFSIKSYGSHKRSLTKH